MGKDHPQGGNQARLTTPQRNICCARPSHALLPGIKADLLLQIVPSARNPSRRIAADLAEHRGQPIEKLDPIGAHLLHEFRFCLVNQAELAPSSARIEHNCHELKI